MCFSFSWLRFWLKIFSILKLMLKRFQWLTIKNGGQAAYLSDVTWTVLFLTFLISLMYVNSGTELHIANFVFKGDISWYHVSFLFVWQRREEGPSVMLIYWQVGRVTSISLIVCKRMMFRRSQLHQILRRKMGSQEHVPIQTVKAFLKRYSHTVYLKSFKMVKAIKLMFTV